MGSITLKQVTKNFDEVNVIKPLDLEIKDGEFIVFVGPSGCGKSTLLRMVSGLLIPFHGEVSVFNLPVTEPRDDVGIVFQKANLLPWLTVKQNILFPLIATSFHMRALN